MLHYISLFVGETGAAFNRDSHIAKETAENYILPNGKRVKKSSLLIAQTVLKEDIVTPIGYYCWFADIEDLEAAKNILMLKVERELTNKYNLITAAKTHFDNFKNNQK